MALPARSRVLARFSAVVAAALLTGGAAWGSEPISPEQVAERMLQAHGGVDAWAALHTFHVEREHQFGDTAPIRFDILAEYRTERIYQEWTAPPGVVVWDGERGWSADWRLHDAIPPRYVAGIGFYLVNLPWFANSDEAKLISAQRRADLPGDGREFIVLRVEFEGDPVRKPRGHEGMRDYYDLYLDPETYRVAGVAQNRTYAAQLDKGGSDRERIVEIFVPSSMVEAAGILWPHEYVVYDEEGVQIMSGRFFDYQLDLPFDEARMQPPAGSEVRFDTTTSYLRTKH